MKTTKLLFGSLLLAGALTACSKDELSVVDIPSTAAERTQINLTLGNGAETRMGVDENGAPIFTKNDVLGAVMVDGGYSAGEWQNVNWDVVAGHAGNNKWAFNGEKFVTEGTTSVGNWLFYTKYNAAMTTSRDGVKFSFPQIQDGGVSDLSMIENNNINFKISPVLAIDGYEGEALNIELGYNSVYNYLQLNLDFAQTGKTVEKVQKILVKAKKKGADYQFPAEYRVVNEKLPYAKLSKNADAPAGIKVKDWDNDNDIDVCDQNFAIAEAVANFTGRTTVGGLKDNFYWDFLTDIKYVEKVGNKAYDYLVVDCDANHSDEATTAGGAAVANNKYSTIMLMPAGLYSEITLTIYTDKGVFEKVVSYRNSYRENLPNSGPLKKGGIYLRPNVVTSLSNVERVGSATSIVEDKDYAAEYDYLAVKELSAEENVITKTADLVNFISGIQAKGTYNVNILTQAQVGGNNPVNDDNAFDAHTLMVINADVMAAIKAKEAVVGDIQLVFKSASKTSLKILGGATEAERLDIHDMSFLVDNNIKSAEVEGYVKVTSNLVADYFNVNGNTEISSEDSDIEHVAVAADAVLTINKKSDYVSLQNKGNVTVTDAEVSISDICNESTITNDGDVICETLYNAEDATITNNGEFAQTETNDESQNDGTFTNNGIFNIWGKFVNNGVMTNAVKAQILVNRTDATDSQYASFTNSAEGTITNYGEIYTTQQNDSESNVIKNLGLIEAKAGSTTYITYNSLENEKTLPTNAATQVMGTVKMDERNPDLKITAGSQQGYKEYTVVDSDLVAGVLEAKTGDLFNKVILSSATTLSEEVAEYVNFVVTSANLTLPEATTLLQEVTFNENAVLTAPVNEPANLCSVICNFTVADGKRVRIPVGSTVYCVSKSGKTYGTGNNKKSYDQSMAANHNKCTNSATIAKFENFGEILVGGKVYAEMTLEQAKKTSTNGVFSGGDGYIAVYYWDCWHHQLYE